MTEQLLNCWACGKEPHCDGDCDDDDVWCQSKKCHNYATAYSPETWNANAQRAHELASTLGIIHDMLFEPWVGVEPTSFGLTIRCTA